MMNNKILHNNPIKSFSRSELDYLCDPNPDMEVEYCQVEKLKYIKIKNFLKHPIELRDFCMAFPTEDTFKSITENTYKEDRSASPGIQQMMDDRFVSKISETLHSIMFEKGMVKYDNDMLMWDYYTNMFYPKMQSVEGNQYPHIDPFSFASNIYLSEVNDCKSGTNFFKCVLKDPDGNEDTFYNVFELKSPLRNTHDYLSVFENYRNVNKKTKNTTFKTFQGDEIYKKYHFIPAEFNSVSIYKGAYWHNIEYGAESSKQYRYSLVGAICNRGGKDKMVRQ